MFYLVGGCQCSKEEIEYLIGCNKEAILEKLPNGDTLLHVAATRGNIIACRSLIMAGVGIESMNRNRLTPLLLACAYGNLNIVEELLSFGANFRAKYSDGNSAIYFCNYPDIVARLIECGLSVNEVNTEGETALHGFASSGNRRMCEFLLERGARKGIVDSRGLSASDWARMSGFDDLSRFLS